MPTRSKTTTSRSKKEATPVPKKPASRNPLADYQEIDRKMRLNRVVNPAPPTPAVDSEAQRRFETLRDVAASLGGEADLEEILIRVVDGILQVAGCERGLVFLTAADGAFETYIGRQRDHADWDERDAREISGTIVSKVAASRQPFIASDLQQIDDLRARDSIHVSQILSAVCLPLLDGDRLIGVIYADSRFVTPQFTDDDRRVLDIFAVQATVAVENARRAGELKIRGEHLAEQNLVLSRKLAREFALQGMVARSRAMLDVFEIVEKIAHSDVSVLVLGESGTGKELVARAIHDKSLRKQGPFEAVNCAGIPESLAQAALFGYRKGAYTNADHEKPGVFEIANGGTLFLDEIGDLPISIQPSFLRVLQEKKVTRIGEEGRLRPVDVRIISATNLDLERAVEDGEFRQDLYFRLNTFVFSLPPLRERPEDIIPLAEYFLDEFAKKEKQPRATLSPDARELLMNQSWPGNVRELKNAIERGILFQDPGGVIHAKALERLLPGRERDASADARAPGTLREQIDRREEEIVRRVLVENDNNVTNAAKALGLSRQQLYQKIRKYQIAVR